MTASARPTDHDSHTNHDAPGRRAAWRFVVHYLEMVVAMILGMVVLYPLWTLATGDVAADSWIHRTDVDSLVMATTMAVPMAAWMHFRGHSAAPVIEMSLAMYAGFVVLFPLLWLGMLGSATVTTVGHVLMFVFMFAAMLLRRDEYTAHHHRHA